MGNTNGKESDPDGHHGSRRPAAEGAAQSTDRDRDRSSRNNRASRSELSFLGITSSSGHRDRNRNREDAPFTHRETRQEREARKLERERAQREKDREKSMKEEQVDGGYLVTLGTYTGTEDYSKTVVRQLLIERKLAPFWRGLNDWSDSWNEHQMIAAARGLPIPAADQAPDPELVARPPPTDQNIQNLTVPMGPRTLSAASDHSVSAAGPASAATGKTSSSPFKAPRAKALAAALGVSSRNTSATELAPREHSLPNDPFVNGQAVEVFLYKNATECPICFLTFPPYLNQTRCCDQPICSECFVQIKRADPHLPEHHPDGQARDPNEGLNPEDPPEMLISEPSACPYCQQPEFGVTYEPPPFRRGLVYSTSSTNVVSSGTPMSSQSSLQATLPAANNPPTTRRRGHSLSVNAPNVITTDRIRPDWKAKLDSVRQHQARRAAAATALHTAAFLVNSENTEQRSILRSGLFGSRRSAGPSSAAAPGGDRTGEEAAPAEQGGNSERQPGRSARRTRMDELEDMMFMEAVRLSLAAEEERKRKDEKAYRKEAKKREKEEKKAQKRQSTHPYNGTSSGASASSLSLGGFGRRRDNSGSSNLRMEATIQGASQTSKTSEATATAGGNKGSAAGEAADSASAGKGKAVERGSSSPEASAVEDSPSPGALPVPSAGGRGSHLRQMSNTSSLGSSGVETPSGSYTGGYASDATNNENAQAKRSDDDDHEPLFNYSSLAEMVGVNLDNGTTNNAAPGQGVSPHSSGDLVRRPLSQVNEDEKEGPEAAHIEQSKPAIALTKPEEQTTSQLSPVQNTPAAVANN